MFTDLKRVSNTLTAYMPMINSKRRSYSCHIFVKERSDRRMPLKKLARGAKFHSKTL